MGPLKFRPQPADEKGMRRVGVFLAGIVIFAGLAAPAALAAAANGGNQSEGTGSSVEADIAAIEAIVADAEAAMSAIVSAFDATVQQATTNTEVQQAANVARQQITDTANQALSEIRAIESGKPGALSTAADSARTAVIGARDAALTSINDIQTAFVAPTTNTTLPPSEETQPGAQPSGGPTSQPGKNSNSGGVGGPNPPGRQPPKGPLVESIVAPPTVIGGDDEPSLPATGNPLVGTVSSALFDNVGSRASVLTDLPDQPLSSISVSPQSGFTLAPALQALVASPLRVLRTVARVTVEGGRTVVVPLGLLTTSVLAFMVLNGRRRPEQSLDFGDPTAH